MPRIHVCSLARLDRTLAETGAATVLSLMREPVERPAGIAPDRHLHLRVSDVVAAGQGLIAPAQAHIGDLIAFARRWL